MKCDQKTEILVQLFDKMFGHLITSVLAVPTLERNCLVNVCGMLDRLDGAFFPFQI